MSKPKFTQFDGILPAFFAGMMEGYVVDQEKLRMYVGHQPGAPAAIPGIPPFILIPGVKATLYHKGDWTVIDAWEVNGFGDWSAGTTRIIWQDQPVWRMNYWGRYPPEVISFLKLALRKAYENGLFMGGRGVPCLDGEGEFADLRYINTPDDYNNNWRCFQGGEYIRRQSNRKRMGWHMYNGLLLVPQS